MPQPWPGAISGEPGERWTNDTGKMRYQLRVSFANSCGQCIQYAGQISTYWNVPFHRNCNCTNVPVPPGGTSQPFVDYWKEVMDLDPAQQARVVGRAALTLIEKKVISWDDVVRRSRIRTLAEVAAEKRLTVPQMVKAGVPEGVARKAVAVGNAPAPTAPPAATLADAYQRLRSAGLSDREIAARLAERLGKRIGIGKGPAGPGPSGPIGGAMPPPKAPPATPAPAAIQLPAPAPVAAKGRPRPTFVLSERDKAEGRVLADVSTAKLEASLARDAGYHVGPGGVGKSSKPGAYRNAVEFVERAAAEGVAIEAPRLAIDRDGSASLTDGRHRFAALRDLGHETIAVSVTRGQAKRAASLFGAASETITRPLVRAVGKYLGARLDAGHRPQ